MEKKLKQVSEGQGFVCKDLDEKKRLWQKLTDAGYPMYREEEHPFIHIKWFVDCFASTSVSKIITDPLNESDFFDDWTPQAGEWVEVCDDGTWLDKPRQYLCTIDGVHLVVATGSDYENQTAFSPWKHIRQIKPETMTLQEVREALGKPNLIIE
jgi:hypothetical protein